MVQHQIKTKCELCPCGCGQVLLPGQAHHSDIVSAHGEDACACSHCAHREEQHAFEKKVLIRIIVGACIYAFALIFVLGGIWEPVLYISAYLVIGGDVLLRAARNIAHGRVFDENLLMSIATIGALAIREYPEAVAVMLFYQVGELFQGYAVGKSRRSITKLMDIRPDYANLLRDGQEHRVSPAQVAVGDVIVVKPGERVPLDGVVQKGSSFVDTSALTGESVPRALKAGDAVYSGCINQSGVIEVRAEKEFAQSTVSRILELVQSASARKAPTEQFISRFARCYTPIVVVVAVLIAAVPPLVIPGAEFSDWLYRALIFLVISCPCALVISIPLGFFGGIGAASREGVLVKGSNYLEALRAADTFVFDKTGTLTEGVFKVSEIKTYGSLSADEVLALAAHIESYSSHPIAKSIAEAYTAKGGELDMPTVTDYEEISGRGLKASVKGQRVLAGNRKLMDESGIPLPDSGLTGTVVYIAAGNTLAGAIAISDRIKPDAKEAVAALKAAGVKKTVMLTGDRQDTAQQVADALGIDAFYAELLPQDKVQRVEELIAQGGGKVAFVGDGINDAPVLARADIGIAMGGLGSDAAIEAADIVIMNDMPSRLAAAIRIARKTRRIVWQNIALAMAVKVAVLVLGAGGIATMWEAVFADVGVALLAVLNALRMLRRSKVNRLGGRSGKPAPTGLA
jgi:Zn2+/Cd2+-exporting ATPase